MAQVLDVRIQRAKDPPLFPELEGRTFVDLEAEAVGVVEALDPKGKIAVVFLLKGPGEYVTRFHVTDNNFLNLAGVVRGLKLRIDDGK